MSRFTHISRGVALFVAIVMLVVGLVVGKAVFGNGDDASASGKAGIAGKKIDVIVKATDSEFWQSMFAGSKKAGEDLGVDVSLFGPTSETDIAPQVSLVESSIARHPDAIVLASNSNTALNGVIKRARSAGIKVINVDNKVTGASDGFIGTDNVKAGEQGGQRMCQLLKARGQESGKVLHENAVSGTQVLMDRFEGFKKGLAESCPQTKITQTLVNDNDINKAVSQVGDALSGSSGFAGVFADNNVSGTGAARAVKTSGKTGKVAVVAFDSDPAEVTAVRAGTIDAIIVQNPFFFGYQGVVEAAMKAAGSNPPVNLDPGAVLVDKKNVDSDRLKALVNPPTVKAD